MPRKAKDKAKDDNAIQDNIQDMIELEMNKELQAIKSKEENENKKKDLEMKYELN